ncbi:acyl carrier protein [Candidatus Pinguicoccus supinus]|uniref:Acyl carrier protein n=1 Tax=Candidatus Pinguicoccus supinus TaxID=2529394 RepID=A0A7T0FY54_9BACT|nr:acyl carrier protein [Candidatus Pinguicoccus supinus]
MNLDAFKIESRVKKVISNQLNILESNISLESNFVSDLGADSLDLVELIIAFEEEFKKDIKSEISEDNAKNLKKVIDVIKFIEQKITDLNTFNG